MAGRREGMAILPLTEEQVGADLLVLNVATVGLSDEQFFQLCLDNRELQLELTARKELVIMTLPGGKTGRRNEIICTNLGIWARQNGTGITFVPLTLFVLPNGAKRAPDASWLKRERWDALTDRQQESAPPLCPDFVVELMSKSDKNRLKMLQAKTAEYMDNGAQLGWLIDPFKRNVYIYRPGKPAQCLENPTTIQGDPVLPGFVFQVSEIW
jgi:Uma2 family endonuclease